MSDSPRWTEESNSEKPPKYYFVSYQPYGNGPPGNAISEVHPLRWKRWLNGYLVIISWQELTYEEAKEFGNNCPASCMLVETSDPDEESL